MNITFLTMAKNFKLAELINSDTANRLRIDNTPSYEVCCNLEALIDNVLQPLRERYGNPIIVNSGYRCTTLNRSVGGASTSQHLRGEAADIVGTSRSKSESKRIFELAISMNLPFDQIIYEHDSSGNYWVHISHKRNGGNRHKVTDNMLKL